MAGQGQWVARSLRDSAECWLGYLEVVTKAYMYNLGPTFVHRDRCLYILL